MFIQCSVCNTKYLVNSADLKPNGRMVECANCGHQWYQDSLLDEDIQNLSSNDQNNENEKINEYNKQSFTKEKDQIKNLPSTFVNEHKVSYFNSFLVLFILFIIFTIFWYIKKYGINLFELIKFYFYEFYFNLNLIISDIAKLIHQIF